MRWSVSLRQSVYLNFRLVANYEDVNVAERLRHDPTMRWIIGGRVAQGERGFAEPDWLLRDACGRGYLRTFLRLPTCRGDR